MASILRVNTLTDASSNNSTAMSVINQGVAKAWLFGASDAVLSDSTNIASSTDNSTGNYTYTFTNAFSNDDSSQTTTANSGVDRNSNTSGRATGSFTIEVFNSSASNNDSAHSATLHGDLA
tara:strand:+ start:199 stop:561 length:363 start_codon:yes stop_codon:yes gene_type:complete